MRPLMTHIHKPITWMILLAVALSVIGIRPIDRAHAQDPNELLNLINQARRVAGVAPLALNSQLQSAAQQQSNDMAFSGNLTHTGANGSTYWDRIAATGYVATVAGENILYRTDQSAQGAFNQWWQSEPHHSNMLSGSFRDAGLAWTPGFSGTYYVTLVLAAPSGPGIRTDPQYPPGVGPYQDYTPRLSDGRLNSTDLAAPVGVFCTSNGGVSVWAINAKNSQGAEAINASPIQIGNALAQAMTSGAHTQISSRGNISLWALTSNELQVQAPDLRETRKTYNYIFPATKCGTPIVTTAVVPTVSTGSNPSSVTVAAPTVVIPSYTYTTANTAGGLVYIVSPGETLYRISRRYGLTVSALAAANNLANPNIIYAGQSLFIPATATVPVRSQSTGTASSSTTSISAYHMVKQGENLYRIALAYGVDLGLLIAVNEIADPTQIYAGQVLIIP